MPKEVKSCHSQLEGPLSAGWPVAINEDKEDTSPTHSAFAENVERKFLLLLLFSGHFEFLILIIFFPLSFVEARARPSNGRFFFSILLLCTINFAFSFFFLKLTSK